jgi:hypothetical protein
MSNVRTTKIRTQNGGSHVTQRFFKTLTCLIACSVAALAYSTVTAGEPSSTGSTIAPKLPADLAKRIGDITNAVLEHHIDPPVRQDMIHGAIKGLFAKARLPVPSGLSRRVSALTTPDQFAALIA